MVELEEKLKTNLEVWIKTAQKFGLNTEHPDYVYNEKAVESRVMNIVVNDKKIEQTDDKYKCPGIPIINC